LARDRTQASRLIQAKRYLTFVIRICLAVPVVGLTIEAAKVAYEASTSQPFFVTDLGPAGMIHGSIALIVVPDVEVRER